MQSVHTMAAPPNQGRICLARRGCTRNSRKALRKTVAACSGMGLDLIIPPGYTRRVLANYIRLMLLLEAAAYVAIAWWLHFLYGWSYAALAAGAVPAVLLGRLGMVFTTTSSGFFARSPREKDHHIGIRGTVAMVLREWRAVLGTNLYCF